VYALSVHTIVDGKLVIVQGSHGMTDVCEGGILMYGEEDGTHYEFYRMKGTELELIEMIYQDRIQKYWVRAVEGENPQSSNCSEETARSYIAQYRPIELNEAVFRVSLQLRKSPLPVYWGQRGFVNLQEPLADCGKRMFLRSRL